MDLINSIFDCLSRPSHSNLNLNLNTNTNTSSNSKPNSPNTLLEKPPFPTNSEEDLAKDILNTLFTYEKSCTALNSHLQSTASTTTNWTESLARRILDGIVSALGGDGMVLVGAMKEACERVRAVADEFVAEHPVLAGVLVTLVAIGVLVLVLPWVVEVLGFGEVGVIEGSWAARWQSTFPDVTKGSLFAFLQRLGMTWGK